MKLPAQLVLSLLSTAAVAPGRAGTLPPRADTYAVKERHGVPPAWTCVGAAPKEAAIHLRIGLRQQNPGAVERHLGEISDPGHARYGRHLGRAEIEALVAPAPESREAVREWLAAYGVGEVSHNAAGDTIHCVVSIAKAEELLRTEFATFRHEDGTRVHRAPEWSLPLHLFDHVDLVQPTTSFLNPGKTCLSDRSPTAQTDWSSPDLAEVLKRQDSQEAQDVSLDISQVCNSRWSSNWPFLMEPFH
jgi:tripeptidyl-peptidase-1